MAIIRIAMEITVETTIYSSFDVVWNAWTEPQHICNWNFASDDWECPKAENDLRPGGKFSYRMAAKDGSMAFDFSGTYTAVEEFNLIEFTLDDDRRVSVSFFEENGSVLVKEVFEAEDQNDPEMQKAGWQAILDNFKSYAETL